MSDAYLSHINPFLEKITILQKLEMSSAIHGSKINSLIRAYKLLPDIITPNPPPNWKNTKKFISIINSLNNSIEHLIQFCIQCNRDSCVQFILMTSFQKTFEDFLSIRQQTISDFQNLNFPKAAEIFTASPDELLSQDQVDLKLIGNLLLQIRIQKDLQDRKDIKERITDRLDSLKRKDIKIDTIKPNFDLCSGIITIPSIPSTLNLVLDHEQLIYHEVIGEGRSGKVYKGNIIGRPDLVVAIKVLHCRELTPAELEMFRREIFTLTTLSHPSILKLLGYTNQPPFCLVTELLANGSIYSFLKTRPQELTPTDRTVIAIDIARGMEYMHERNIIHRDLKSLNILLDDNKRARICDFGLVRLKSYAPMTGLIGTPQWMAPEIFMCSTSYNIKADVYSYAIVLWELLTGNSPYEGVPVEKIPYLVVQENRRPEIPDDTPADLRDLIKSCWDADASKRPSFSMVIKAFYNPKNHFLGTNEEELMTRLGLKKFDNQSSLDNQQVQSSPSLLQSLNCSGNNGSSNDDGSKEMIVFEPFPASSSLIRKPSLKLNRNSIKRDSVDPNTNSELMSTPNMNCSLLNVHTYRLSNSTIPINHVDQVVLKYVESVAKNDLANLELSLNEIISLYKSGVLLTIPNSFIPETVKILRSSNKESETNKISVNDEIKIKILETLVGFLGNRALFDQFVISDGFSMLSDLMHSSNTSIAELALITTAKHLRKEIITIDLIKSLLVFNSSNDNKIRNFALTTLFFVIDFQFDMLCKMPTFIYHLVCFALKPLPLQSFEQLLHVTLKFINKIQSFPAPVMPQLIWLQTNVPRQFRSIAVECLVSAVRLEEGRMCFPPEFWRYAQRDFNSYLSLFISYVHGVTGIVHKGCYCCFCTSSNSEKQKQQHQEGNDQFKLKERASSESANESQNQFELQENDKKETEDGNANEQNKDNLNGNSPIVAKLPPRYDELVIVLKESSSENREALQLLIELTRDLRCASVVLTRLPIENKTSPILLFKLYSNLSLVDGSSQILGGEGEFYSVCKLALGSKYQSEACQLIRKINLNPFLLESSCLVDSISSVLLTSTSKFFTNTQIPQIKPIVGNSKSSINFTQKNINAISMSNQTKFKTLTKSKSKLKSSSSKIKITSKNEIDEDNFVSTAALKVSRSLSKTVKVKSDNLSSRKKSVFSIEENNEEASALSQPNSIDNSIEADGDSIENENPLSKSIDEENAASSNNDLLADYKEEELWNLMSVVFTISQNRFFPCFQLITNNLQSLMTNSSSNKLKVGAFLCLASFSLSSDEKSASSNSGYELISVLLTAAELVNSENHAVQAVCVNCMRKNIEKVPKKDLKQIISVFLQFYEKQYSLSKPVNDESSCNDADESSEPFQLAFILYERCKKINSSSVNDENNINYNKTEKIPSEEAVVADGGEKAVHMSKTKLLQYLAEVCSQK